MKFKKVKIEGLQPHPMNYNRHPDEQIQELEKSLEQFGQFKNIVVCQNTILAGHGLVEAAKRKGMTEIYALVRDDLAEDQQKALLIADNATPFLAMPDTEALEDLLKSIPDLSFDDMPGVTTEWLESMDVSFNGLFGAPSSGEDDSAADDVPEVEEAITKLGDLWQLENHRLLCGDATKREDVERLMGGKNADMVFTDPPYGIKVVNKSGKVGGGNLCETGTYRQIIGDETTKTAEQVYSIVKSFQIQKQIIWGGNYFTHFLPPQSCWIVWDKKGEMESNNFADGEVAWTNFDAPLRIYRHIWRGMIKEGENDKRLHPTQKPVNLCIKILNDFNGESIVDLFGGSGSTLIACEKTGRKCFMMELDPHYCTVIIKRWEQYTGKQSVLLK